MAEQRLRRRAQTIYDQRMTAGLSRNPCRLWPLFLLLAYPPASSRAETERELGRPFLHNFALRDYHAHNQNWAAAQDAQGILYFGNKNVVLEYDGVAWRKIHIDATTYVRGLAIDPSTGTMFVGAVDELGYFAIGPAGEKQYVSLREKLPTDARDFRDIRRLHVLREGVFFVADQQVMRWREGAFKVWKFPNASRMQSHSVGGQLYLQHPDLGLLRLEGDNFTAASADPLFRRAQITLLTPGSDRSLLVGTLDDGLFTLRDGVAAPFATEVDDFLKSKKIRRGLRMRDGSLALATATSGLTVLGPEGQLRSRVDEAADLQNDTILDLFEDRESGLWLCLNSGITRVEAGSPLSIFDPANGLKRGTVRDVLRVNGVLHLAGSDGLYRLAPADPASARTAHCERIPGTESEWWSLCSHEAGLVAGGVEGVTQLDERGGTRKLLSSVPALVLRRSRVDPERVFIGTRNGLRSIHYEPTGLWRDEGLVAGTSAEIRTIVETADGVVWLATPINGVLRVTFAPSARGERGVASVALFYETQGLPKGQHWTRVIEGKDGETLFSTQAGLFRFDETAQLFQPVPDFGARFVDGSFMLAAIAQDAARRLWVSGRAPNGNWLDQELYRASPDKSVTALPYKIADKIGEIEKFYPEGEGAEAVVWISGTDGLVRVEQARLTSISPTPEFATIIRRALTTTSAGSAGGPTPIVSGVLPYTRNSLRFEFAANTFAIGATPKYQTRLSGFEGSHWSDFSERTSVDYTNVPEGAYVFEVRARDVDGRLGTTASFPFRITPPWQRTPWAYAAYALLLIAAVVGLTRWQLRRFRRKQGTLESIVAERTGELRAREVELLRAKESADSANRAKSAFLANMSHELRTPLNAILGYTQIILKDESLSEKNRERLTTVGQSGGHLLAMINEVLDLSKIEAGKLTLNPTEASLKDLLEDVCAAFRQRVAEKGLALNCQAADDVPAMVRVDAGKLRQVLFNLLGNAIKFTETGLVSLAIKRALGGQISFEVIDTGVGIPAEELRDIFLTFHQASNSNLAAQGTGLGLAISKHLVTLLGGELHVESTPGEGSRFWFELDLPVLAAPASSAGTAPRRAAVTGFRGTTRRLLIADDERTNRSVLRELLQPLGFEIEEATDGAECLQRCAARPPDALLLDLQMPELDGFDVTRRLRAEGTNRALKIIAVSASVFEDDRQQAIDAGCDDFLPKPFQEEQLLSVLGKALALEWIHNGTAAAIVEPLSASGDHGQAPPPEEIDAMLELSRRGDILGIKKRLAALAAADGASYGNFVHSLEPFVAGYQMNRIRDALLKFKEEEPS